MRVCYPSARVIYDRRHVSSEKKKGTVEIEVLYRRKRVWLSTGVHVLPNEWSEKRNQVKGRHDILVLNGRINDLMHRIELCFMDAERNDVEWNWEMLDDALGVNKSKGCLDTKLIPWIEERITHRGDVRDSTKRTHTSLVNKLKDFGRITTFRDVNVMRLTEFDDYLHTFGYTQTTVHGYHKRLKRYINEAVMMGIIKENPYQRMKIKRGTPKGLKYLTEDEMAKIKGAKIGLATIDRVRDLFLFQCYTGMAYADMAAFDFSKVEERQGRWFLKDDRVKSEETYWILLMRPAKEILEKYEMKLPIISNQQYNLRLKILADMAGLERNLTSHMGRHTFAVEAINMGIQIETLAKMMGHTNIKTTQVYAKVIGKTVEEAMIGLEEKIIKKKKNEKE